MIKMKIYLSIILLIALSGCVQHQYNWSNYDQKLYNHYKNPAEQEKFILDLKEIIARGESDGKVPPGIYAEYGYALYERGEFPEAIDYFQKEQERWPESSVLMAKMIDNAGKNTSLKQAPSDEIKTANAEESQ